MKTKLNDVQLKALPLRESQYEVFDHGIPGFGVRISPKGTKTFVLLYRIGGTSRRLTIGRYPTTSLKSAREQAKLALAEISAGRDPQAAKILDRQKYQSLLFPHVVSDYITLYAKRHTRSWRETERILTKQFQPHWEAIRVHEITKTHVNAVIDHIYNNNGHTAANTAFAIVRKFFNWCIERDLLTNTPCYGLKKPAKTRPRDRVLSKQEIAASWAAASTFGYPYEQFFKLAMLTGQRRREVANLRWDAIDLDAAIWKQTVRDNKSDREHLIPLCKEAVEIFKSIPRLHPTLIFPARGNDSNSISGFSKWKERMNQKSNTSGWTLHDLRRTINTVLAEAEIPIHIGDLILNHGSRSLSGVTGIYNRYNYLAEKRAAMTIWGNYISDLINDPTIDEPTHEMETETETDRSLV